MGSLSSSPFFDSSFSSEPSVLSDFSDFLLLRLRDRFFASLPASFSSDFPLFPDSLRATLDFSDPAFDFLLRLTDLSSSSLSSFSSDLDSDFDALLLLDSLLSFDALLSLLTLRALDASCAFFFSVAFFPSFELLEDALLALLEDAALGARAALLSTLSRRRFTLRWFCVLVFRPPPRWPAALRLRFLPAMLLRPRLGLRAPSRRP